MNISRIIRIRLTFWLFLATTTRCIALQEFYTNFSLTLSPSASREAFGPFFYREESGLVSTWAVPPLIAHAEDDTTDFDEWDSLYPFLTLDRFGNEYRFQIFQLFSFSGGGSQNETNFHRFSLFPFYFQQRSKIPERNYTALFPIAGRIRNRFFRDDIRFALFPIWSRTHKREVVTDNYLYPLLHRRAGGGVNGWQVWPLVGHEAKKVTQRTDQWGDVETVGGHDKWFVLWPIWFHQKTGLGTTNVRTDHAVIPLYTTTRSTLRDVTTIPWPIGYTYIEDRGENYREWGMPWPLVAFRRGEKYTTRVWPLFSHARDATKESVFYLWPVYKHNRITSAPLDRTRTRILLFLYNDIREKNTETGQTSRRKDLWPLFTARKDLQGNERLQVLSLLEPILPASKSIERNYSPLWALWRSERNPRTGAVYQSLLWDLYRRQSTPETKKVSLLFGLFKYQSTPKGKQTRIFFVPFSEDP